MPSPHFSPPLALTRPRRPVAAVRPGMRHRWGKPRG